jgi:hypothetical protein
MPRLHPPAGFHARGREIFKWCDYSKEFYIYKLKENFHNWIITSVTDQCRRHRVVTLIDQYY